MEEYRTYRLGDIAECTLGKMLDQKKNKGKPHVYLGNVAVRWGAFNIDPSQAMRFEDKEIEKFQAVKGDIILCEGGEPGRCAIWEDDEPICIQKALHRIRVDQSIASPYYVYYYLTSFVKSGKAEPYFTGSTIKHLPRERLISLELTLPCLDEQKRRARIIQSLDAKISLNNRINHNLEEQAQALYKSWFVDFEPFKGGKFVDSELGMIPEGWRVAELGTVTRQSSQKVKDRIDVKVLSPVTTGELVLSEEYFTKQVFSESISKYIVVKPLHFAYNPARVNIGSIGMNMFSFDGCVSPVYVVFECEKGYHHFFDYYRKTESFKDEVLNRAIGGVRQTLSYKDFALIKLVYPPYDIVEKFNCIYAGLLENKNSIKREISKLSELRDTLLPKLLSGELKIDDFTC